VYMRKDSEMESSGLGLYSVFHVLMSKPKATDFHLSETQSIYVVLIRISLDVRGSLYARFGVSLSTGPIHVQSSPQLGSTLSNICKSNLVTCNVMRLNFRS